MSDIKDILLNKCLEVIRERIKSAEQAIVSAKEASQDDTKSSAGDKYETTREMMQQEISRNESQLFESRKLEHTLMQLPKTSNTDIVQNGSLVYTTIGNFFISAGAGQFEVDGLNYFTISAVSPLGRALAGTKRDGEVDFKGRQYQIKEIT